VLNENRSWIVSNHERMKSSVYSYSDPWLLFTASAWHAVEGLWFWPSPHTVLRNLATIYKVVFVLWKICSATTIEQNLSQKSASGFQAGEKILISFRQDRQQQQKKTSTAETTATAGKLATARRSALTEMQTTTRTQQQQKPGTVCALGTEGESTTEGKPATVMMLGISSDDEMPATVGASCQQQQRRFQN
jgi:hypothetical protein